MSEQPDLANLPVKELRQLAGEHHIQNAHRMGKERLLKTLHAAMAARQADALAADDAPAGEPAEPLAMAAAAAAPVAQDEAPAPRRAPAPVAPSTDEPEVITPETVADLTANPAEGAEPEVLDAAAVAGLTDAPAGPAGEGEPRRRRRRRRRRRGGDRDGHPGDAQGADGEDDEDVGDEPGDAQAPQHQAKAPQAQDPAAPVGESPVSAEPSGETPRPAPRSVVDQPAHERGPREPRSQPARSDARPDLRQAHGPAGHGADPRPSRPRLNGPQRPVPSVLDRLSSFARGIVELCEPDTPRWAQPRLAELLAEAGVVETPWQGTPLHPDFHLVVGTVAGTGQPNGTIVERVTPGFSLRGDRGDLFCLSRAEVRIAGDRSEAVTAAPAAGSTLASAPRPQPRLPEPRQERGPRPERTERAPMEREARAPLAMPAPVADDAAPETDDAPRAEAPTRVRPPVPSPGRSPERLHPRESASVAPTLPLSRITDDELAQKPKAEGFRALGLNEQILSDLAATGWQNPTPIQAAAIPIILTGKDVIGQAQTGSGKTGAFVLPTLQKLYALEGEGPVGLMLCPTRELAKQVFAEFTKMAGASGARAALIYGGVDFNEQFRAIDRKPHVIIGTPGRIIDHMKRKTLDFSRLATVVLDEADQMLDIGFWPDVTYIMGHTPPSRQVLLFSATFPDPIKELAEKHMREPERVHIAPEQVTVDTVDQKYIAVPRDRKNDLLAHFIETYNPERLVVFCKTKHQTDRVAEVLKRKKLSAGAIHGDLPQSKRERTLSDFRGGTLQCLIATNVAARGLDIPAVSHVVNYDIPEMPEEYVHRIGRTARAGNKGVARTFITPEDGQFLLEIEKHIGLLLEEEKVEGFELPPPKEVKRTIADAVVTGTTKLLKPLIGGIRLGRRRR